MPAISTYLKSAIFLGLLSSAGATSVCTCDAGSGGVSQNGFTQILNGLNVNSHDQFCVNAPDYTGCYKSGSATQGLASFYACGIFCADPGDSGACLFTTAYTAYLGANTGGCISKGELISIVESMAMDAEQYQTANAISDETNGDIRVVVQNGYSVIGGNQCDPGVC
jgi:hypothetical protein